MSNRDLSTTEGREHELVELRMSVRIISDELNRTERGNIRMLQTIREGLEIAAGAMAQLEAAVQAAEVAEAGIGGGT